MSVDLTQLMRFEVERPVDSGELLNLVPNPDGRLGAWGWITPTVGSFLRGGVSVIPTRHYRLIYTSPGSVASKFYTEPIPVAVGQYVAARWFAWDVDGLYNARIEWLNSAGAILSATAATSNLAESADAHIYASFVAPASTAYCRLRFDHLSGSGGNPGAGTTMQLHDVVLTAAASSGALGYQRTNLVTNPSAETGTTGWFADGGDLASSAAQAVVGTHSFELTKTGKKGGMGATTLISVQGGRDYAIQVRVRPDSTARVAGVNVTWTHPGGKAIEKTVALHNEDSGAWSGAFGGVVTAPTDAVLMGLRVAFGAVPVGEVHNFDAVMVEQAIAVGSYFDGSTTDADGITYDWTGSAHASTSIATGATGDVGTLVPVPYQNVLGPTAQISIDREDLNVGSLTARIFDAILDPTQTDLISPGRRVRVTTVDGDVVFAGKILTGNVTYHLLEREEQKRAEITLTAVDPIQPLAAAKRREGVATVAELPYVLEGAGVPWNVNGSGDQVASATVVAYNDNASALDQVAVTRDSVLGYAWVNRTGVLEVWDRDELDDTVAAELDESAYGADIDIDWDLDRIINSVSVIVLNQIATTGATEEVTFGPYIDQDSYRANGEHHADYTVAGFDVSDAAAIAAYAQQILDANAQPTQRVNTLTLPVRDASELPNALRDLYDLVHVTNERAGYEEDVRVTTVQHDITPSKWVVTLGFSADGAVAQSTAVPSPSPGVREVVDEVKGGYGGTLQDIFDAAGAAAADAATAAAIGTAAATTANGKNKVTWSASGPGATPNTAGDIWWQRSGALIAGQWVGAGGTSWTSQTIAGAVIAYLDAGSITAGTAFANALTVLTNFTLGNSFTNGVIQTYNFAGSTVGVYIDKFGIVAKGGSLSGTDINGATITGGVFQSTTAGGRGVKVSTSGLFCYANDGSGGLFGVDFVGKSVFTSTDLSVGGDVSADSYFMSTAVASAGGNALFEGAAGLIRPNVAPSLSKWKRDVAPLPVDLDSLGELGRGAISFRYRDDVDLPFGVDDFDETFYGVSLDLAVELGGLEILVGSDDAGNPFQFLERRLPIALLAGYGHDHRRIAELEAQNAALITRLDALEGRA